MAKKPKPKPTLEERQARRLAAMGVRKELLEGFRPNKRNKFNAVRTEIDGIVFASGKEAARYVELKYLLRAGEIADLELQPKYPMVVNGVLVCTYIGDFRYTDMITGTQVVEDVKSKATKTAVYRLKKKLLLALWGVVLKERE